MVPTTEYRAILATDITGSAGRGDSALHSIRDGLFTALRQAIEHSGINWEECSWRDTGDGAWLIMPTRVQKAQLIHPLGYELAVLLRAYNLRAAPSTQVRVRMALHAGDIHFDPQGTATGTALEVTARLLDSPAAREALAGDGGTAPLAIIVSPHFYDETVPHGYPGVERDSFRRVAVTVKEYTADAWLWLPLVPELAPAPGTSGLPSSEENPAGPASIAREPGQATVSAGRDLGIVVIGNANTVHEWHAARRHP